MKKTALFTLVAFGSVLVLAGCQSQLTQLKSKNLCQVKKVETDNAEVTQKTLVNPDQKVIKETEMKIKKPADVDKVVKEVDKALNEINTDELNLDL